MIIEWWHHKAIIGICFSPYILFCMKLQNWLFYGSDLLLSLIVQCYTSFVFCHIYEHIYNYADNEIIPELPQANLKDVIPDYHMEQHLLYDAFHSVQKVYILEKKYDNQM